MEFLKNLTQGVSNALDFVVEKNEKFSRINKVKKLIKKEFSFVVKQYIKLGKHYYEELRDVPNQEMKTVCDNIERSKGEIKKLKEKLVQLNSDGVSYDVKNVWDEDVSLVSEEVDK